MPGDHYGRIAGVSARESRQLRAERDAALAASAKAQAGLTTAAAEEARLRALLVANGIDPNTGGTPPPPPGVPGLQTLDLGGGTIRVFWVNFVPTQIGRNGVDSTGFGAYDTSMAVPPGLTATQLANGYFDFLSLIPGDTYLITALYSGGQVTISATVALPTGGGGGGLTPTLSATYRGSGIYRLTWANFTPTQLGRSGTDIYGSGLYDTSTHPDVLAAALTAGYMDMTGLLGFTQYTFTALYNTTSTATTIWTETFDGTNGTLPAGVTGATSRPLVTDAYAQITNNELDLYVDGRAGIDDYSYVDVSAFNGTDGILDFKWHYDTLAMHGPSAFQRNNGVYPNHSGLGFGLEPPGGGTTGDLGELILAWRDTTTWHPLITKPFAAPAPGTLLYGRFLVIGDDMWAYLGLVPIGAQPWDTTNPNMIFTAGANNIPGPGAGQFYNGEHGYASGPCHVYVNDASYTAITNAVASATVVVTVPDTGAQGVGGGGGGTGTALFTADFSGAVGTPLASIAPWQVAIEGTTASAKLDGAGGVVFETQDGGYVGRVRAIPGSTTYGDCVINFSFTTHATIHEGTFGIFERADNIDTATAYMTSVLPTLNSIEVTKQTPQAGFLEYPGLGVAPVTFAPLTAYNGQILIQGNTQKLWVGTGTFPGTYLVTAMDTDITTPGIVGIHLSPGLATLTNGVTLTSFVVSAVGSNPLNPPPSGPFRFGAFNGYGFSGADSFDALTFNAQGEPMTYLVSDDIGGLSTIFAYLGTHPGTRAKLSLNILNGEPGNFGSTAEILKIRSMCQAIVASGFADRFDLRPGYEANGDFGFEWQPRSHGDNFAGYIDLMRRIIVEARSRFPFPILQNFVPWDANIAEMESCYIGDAYVDQITMDNYNSFGTEAQAFARMTNSGIPFARSHNKPFGRDEWANAIVADGGQGDDPSFIHDVFGEARGATDCVSITWYDSPVGGIDETIADQPNSLAAMISELNTSFP